MTSEDVSIDRSDAVHVLQSLDLSTVNLRHQPSKLNIESVSGGVNDVFTVSTDQSTDSRLVVKFGTFSKPDHFRAGVIAYRVLKAYTDLPVPTIYAAELDDEAVPPVLVMEYLPGEELAEGFHDTRRVTDPDAVRLLGKVIDAFGRIPDHGAEGYGFVRNLQHHAGQPRAVGEYDDCRSWLVDYAEQFYSDPPNHEALQSVVPNVIDYLRTQSERLPTTPRQSIVITDLSPQNLLSSDRSAPISLHEITGIIDLERAKLGPVEFTAVNTEYLLTRYVSDPEPIREALYDPLPFQPNMPARDLYQLIAMGRSVGALPFWYEPGSKTYRERGNAIASQIKQIVE